MARRTPQLPTPILSSYPKVNLLRKRTIPGTVVLVLTSKTQVLLVQLERKVIQKILAAGKERAVRLIERNSPSFYATTVGNINLDV
jgi:hypothetical protein